MLAECSVHCAETEQQEMREMVAEVGGDGANKKHPHKNEVILQKLYRKPNNIFFSQD